MLDNKCLRAKGLNGNPAFSDAWIDDVGIASWKGKFTVIIPDAPLSGIVGESKRPSYLRLSRTPVSSIVPPAAMRTTEIVGNEGAMSWTITCPAWT